jgi:hypothetical protein
VGKGIIMLPVVLAIEGKSMAGEPNFRIVLFQLGHSQNNRIMGQLRYEKLDFFRNNLQFLIAFSRNK